MVPHLSRLGVLVNPDGPYTASFMKNLYAAAHKAGIVLTRMDARKTQDIDTVFAAANERGGLDSMLTVSDSLFTAQRYRIAELALAARWPSQFQQREFVEAGGLMSYGQGFREFFRRARHFTSTRFSGAPSQPTCLSSNLQNSIS